MDKNLIKQVLLEQKKEIAEIFKSNIIQRDLFAKSSKMLPSNLIKVIMGARRCGKSTFAHQLLQNKIYGYIDFDDERLIGTKSKDLNNFLEALNEIEPNCRHLLLDEIQNVGGWELFVNRLKRNNYNIIVTGSNSELLSKELASHLTGRHFTIELFPFSFKEFLSFKKFAVDGEKTFLVTEDRAKIKRLFQEYLKFGGFPEVLNMELKTTYLRELYDKIITRDIISRYNIKYIKNLKEVALYSISNFASKISFHKIKNMLEMKSIHTIKNYMHFLEESYLLFQLNAFSFKLKEQFKLPKKIYCIDTGLINAIIPKSTADLGRLIENKVFLELRRLGKDVYFYSKNNYEVDFLIREGQKVTQLIQVCYSLNQYDTKKREFRSLIKASVELKCKNLLVITFDEEGEANIDSKVVRVIPIWKWLLT